MLHCDTRMQVSPPLQHAAQVHHCCIACCIALWSSGRCYKDLGTWTCGQRDQLGSAGALSRYHARHILQAQGLCTHHRRRRSYSRSRSRDRDYRRRRSPSPYRRRSRSPRRLLQPAHRKHAVLAQMIARGTQVNLRAAPSLGSPQSRGAHMH